MQVIADLHLHSPYARAVSKNITLEKMAEWAQKKGIDLITPADWTHPIWLAELKNNLIEVNEGIFKLRLETGGQRLDQVSEPHFLLSTEVSCAYHQEGRYHAVHILIFAPNLETVGKINKKLKELGQNLLSDGRPILNLSCRDLAAHVLDIDSNCLLIPAHAWTPWFGFYGAHGGFDSLDDAFKDYTKYIYAVETGLGSDPAMNWRIKELDNRNIVSFSDAHSLPKIGREATVFEVPELTYGNIKEAIVNKPEARGQRLETRKKKNLASSFQPQISCTFEFYREEGKYHYTGHRKCGVSFSPEETKKIGLTCPVCWKKLTVGALQRTEDLAVRGESINCKLDINSVRRVYSKNGSRPPFVNFVPLQEILSEVLQVGVGSKKVQTEYERLVSGLAPEFDILLNTPLGNIEKFGGERLREAMGKVREGNIFVKPGYDGIFGTVSIWPHGEEQKLEKPRQESIF